MKGEIEKPQRSIKNLFFSGVLVLAIANFLVKAVGLISKIALNRVVGSVGAGYYSSAYEIYATTLQGKLLIKFIPYSMLDADNQSYARICAEELCEMLNDKL